MDQTVDRYSVLIDPDPSDPEGLVIVLCVESVSGRWQPWIDRNDGRGVVKATHDFEALDAAQSWCIEQVKDVIAGSEGD